MSVYCLNCGQTRNLSSELCPKTLDNHHWVENIPVTRRPGAPDPEKMMEDLLAVRERQGVRRQAQRVFRPPYTVLVSRETNWWLLDVPELDTCGQSQYFVDIERDAIGIVAGWLNVPPEDVSVRLRFEGRWL